MRIHLLSFLLVFLAGVALGQAPQSTIRVAVKADSEPVSDATVTVNGRSGQTGIDGGAVSTAALGQADVTVNKEGFFPAHASVMVIAAHQAEVDFELQPKHAEEQEVTVYATRTDVRMEDSPLHVEVVSQDEINEELAMRPGDISMMLNEMGGMRVQTTSPGLGAASLRL